MPTRLRRPVSWLDPLGRLLLALVFVQSLLGKLGDPGAVQGLLQARGVPLSGPVTAASLSVLAVGSALLITGWRRRLGALLLLLFLIPATVVFHLALDDPQQRIQLFKNLAIIGGLLLVIEPGRQSDSRPRL